MDLFRKCGVLFVLALIVDLTQTIHIRACAEQDMFRSTSTIVAVYIIGFWGHNWFVEHKSSWARWMLTVSGALGAGVGTGVVIFLGW